MTNQDPQALITPGGFCRRLGISRWTFYAWRKAGIIPAPHIHKGKISRWTANAVEQFVTRDGATA